MHELFYLSLISYLDPYIEESNLFHKYHCFTIKVLLSVNVYSGHFILRTHSHSEYDQRRAWCFLPNSSWNKVLAMHNYPFFQFLLCTQLVSHNSSWHFVFQSNFCSANFV